MDLDIRGGSVAEPSVNEGAFWHTNMDLYYGYISGEVVEVEHEPMKYWLARIQFSYKHLVLLKWLGNYGEEFWIDTSLASSAATGLSNTTSCSAMVDGNNSFLIDHPRRLFPLGHHLQPQIKSQFVLEKPTKILIKPSLYNPAKDPYADIKTVDDLLAHEIDSTASDAFANQSISNNINESASLALVKNKTKINYGQEDQDELEAALMNLNDEIDRNEEECGPQEALTSSSMIEKDIPTRTMDVPDNAQNDRSTQNKDSGIESDTSNTNHSERVQGDKANITSSSGANDNTLVSNEFVGKISDNQKKSDEEQQDKNNDEARVEMCKKLQESAISKGRYLGIKPTSNDQCNDEIYFLKPKQFFDIGGANQERVFVPGTLVEICHTIEASNELSIYHWFAFVVKNTGGRLLLRWFVCDEPKFKQGRLELKSCRSRFIQEEEPNPPDTVPQDDEGNRVAAIDDSRIPVKSLTFSVHFCDPKVHTITYAKQNGREYKLPDGIYKHLVDKHGLENSNEFEIEAYVESVVKSQLDHIFDPRRMNLDKDRPLIDHILSIVRNKAPNYLDLVFAPKDIESKREVLISCPKMTKLLRGCIKRELEPNVFEVCSDPLPEAENIRFIYPFDSSYAILPMNWADDNRDCLSMDPSRNTSPSRSTKDDSKSTENDNGDALDNKMTNDQQGEERKSTESHSESQQQESTLSKTTSCLIANRNNFPRVYGSYHKLPDLNSFNMLPELKSKISNLDDYDPKCWSSILRSHELEAESFHCCIDSEMKDSIEAKFKVMDLLEVVHPSSDSTICLGRIRKVAYPLLWIQLSIDSYTLLPFNSTNIYPAKWCETYQHHLVSFLPPRKRQYDRTQSEQSQQNQEQKKKKKIKIDEPKFTSDGRPDYDQIYVKESFDLGALGDRQLGIDYILNEKSMYIKIFFNHKCFTGPSLSKSKICTLPQYVGPGPMRLVMEEVVTKVISVAYVPPRILNDLSSKSFEDLLNMRNFKNTAPVEFKAKYQKRVHREDIPVCLNPDDVALYCECLCEHLKCCYNLFGPNQYDGDDCPGHCRALTKSNKYMKRATYYRDKARAGEFVGTTGSSTNSNDASKKSNGGTKSTSVATSRPRYAGRGSSESNCSSVSRSEQVISRASSSSTGSDSPGNEEPKLECLNTVMEEEEFHIDQNRDAPDSPGNDENVCNKKCKQTKNESDRRSPTHSDHSNQRSSTVSNSQPQARVNADVSKPSMNSEPNHLGDDDFDNFSGDNNELIANDPKEWSVDDVCRALEALGLSIFVRKMRSESIDGRALLLLDEATIEEHFQKQSHVDLVSDELEKLYRFVEFAKVRLAS